MAGDVLAHHLNKVMHRVAPQSGLQALFASPVDATKAQSARDTLSELVLLKRTRFDNDSSVTTNEAEKRIRYGGNQQPQQRRFTEYARDHCSNYYDSIGSSSSSTCTSRGHSDSIVAPNGDINSCNSMNPGPTQSQRRQDLYTTHFGWKAIDNYSSPSRDAMNIQSSSPITIPSSTLPHERTVADYFATPKPAVKSHPSIFNVQSRPQKGLRTTISSPDEILFDDHIEPMTSDDICRCCYRVVTDSVMSQRCCFCMKTGCGTCMKECESCYELFCLHCSTSNYSNSYERNLCLDCEAEIR